jgi:CBS domain-containing protein
MQTPAANIIDFRNATDLGDAVVEAVTISPHGNLKGAANLMRDRQVAALAVIWNKKIIGLVTERDIVVALSEHNAIAGSMRVEDAMRRRVSYISSDCTIEDAIRLMVGEKCQQLPVVDGGNLVGIVSLVDLLKD